MLKETLGGCDPGDEESPRASPLPKKLFRNKSHTTAQLKDIESRQKVQIYLLTDTPILDLCAELSTEHATVTFKNNEFDKTSVERKRTVRSGNAAYVTQLGYRIQQLALESTKVMDILKQNKNWRSFETNFLESSLANMIGVLYDDPRQPTADDEEESFLTRLAGNFKKQANEDENKPTGLGLKIKIVSDDDFEEEE